MADSGGPVRAAYLVAEQKGYLFAGGPPLSKRQSCYAGNQRADLICRNVVLQISINEVCWRHDYLVLRAEEIEQRAVVFPWQREAAGATDYATRHDCDRLA